MKLIVFILTSRCGFDMGSPMCSTNYKELYEIMEREYEDTLHDLDGGYVKEGTFCSNYEATIVTGGDQHEWFITEHEIEVRMPMFKKNRVNRMPKYMGISLDFEKLLSREELINTLQRNGSNYKALSNIRDQYCEAFGVELVWHYRLDDGMHTGFMMVPIKEGFLYLPYDIVNEDEYEVFRLDHAKMFDDQSFDNLIADMKSYAKEICRTMQEARGIERYRKCTADGRGLFRRRSKNGI